MDTEIWTVDQVNALNQLASNDPKEPLNAVLVKLLASHEQLRSQLATLEAERDGLRERVEVLHKDYGESLRMASQASHDLQVELATLRIELGAECERLKKDAERWKWIAGQIFTEPHLKFRDQTVFCCELGPCADGTTLAEFVDQQLQEPTT